MLRSGINRVGGKFRLLKRLQNYTPEHLLETDNAILIEDSKTDSFWGIGKLGRGKNMLGKLLIKVRAFYKIED